ncbi:ABC transporter permease subunit [Faecalimicrobium sp. JNUCC 81]
MNIFKFEFKRLLKSCIIWSIVCSGLIILFMSIFPSMESSGMKELVIDKMSALPIDLLKALNIEATDFTNIFDYLSYAIQYIAMASAIYGAILGVNALIREESEGTIEFLYSKPIKRSKIITYKLCSIVAIYFIYIIITCVLTIGISYIVKPHNIKGIDLIINIKLLFSAILLLGYIFMAVGLLISSLIKSDKSSISIAISIFFITYFLGMVGRLKDSFEWFKYLSPFDYYVPSDILKNGFDTIFVIIGIFIIMVSIALSYIVYSKKDMKI